MFKKIAFFISVLLLVLSFISCENILSQDDSSYQNYTTDQAPATKDYEDWDVKW